MFKSYGAITVIFGFLDELEALKFQLVSAWMYASGVGRVQTRFLLPRSLYFTWCTDQQESYEVK